MKLHLFPILNHFTFPETFLVMTFLSLLAGAPGVRPPWPPIPVPPPWCQAGRGQRQGPGGRQLLGLGLAAHGCGDGGRLAAAAAGMMVTRRDQGSARALRGPLSAPATDRTLQYVFITASHLQNLFSFVPLSSDILLYN